MAVRTITFQVALIVIIIVGILIVIHSAWMLAELNRVNGTPCPCSGVTDVELNRSRTFSILMLLIGLGIIIYAVVMFFIPTSERREYYRERLAYPREREGYYREPTREREVIRERFTQKDD